MKNWHEVIKMPVVADDLRAVDLAELERVLLASSATCAYDCSIINKGVINICLSGGLDSSLNLAMIRHSFPDMPINAFTVGSDDHHPDISLSAEVAKAYRVSHHYILTPGKTAISEAQKELALIEHSIPESLGEVAVFLLYAFMASKDVKAVIAHDGIDEILGGYWSHRSPRSQEEKSAAFKKYWAELAPKHLLPLTAKAEYHWVEVFLPYLDECVVETISHIFLDDRTSHAVSKIPLRHLAEKFGVPQSVINRQKIGFCDALSAF